MKRRTDLYSVIESHEISGVLEAGSQFSGKLSFHGTLRIAGDFEGEIFTNDILVVGEGARVKAKIEAGTVIINGEVTGDIVAKNRVEINRPAIFRGSITTPSLLVAEGVIFEGSSKMVTTQIPN